MGIKAQRPRCFLDIGIGNVLGEINNNNSLTSVLIQGNIQFS